MIAVLMRNEDGPYAVDVEPAAREAPDRLPAAYPCIHENGIAVVPHVVAIAIAS